MADKRFRGRDKIVQKMTKDGLVEENLRTGETKSAVEEEPPKQEDSEKDAAESAEEAVQQRSMERAVPLSERRILVRMLT